MSASPWKNRRAWSLARLMRSSPSSRITPSDELSRASASRAWADLRSDTSRAIMARRLSCITASERSSVPASSSPGVGIGASSSPSEMRPATRTAAPRGRRIDRLSSQATISDNARMAKVAATFAVRELSIARNASWRIRKPSPAVKSISRSNRLTILSPSASSARHSAASMPSGMLFRRRRFQSSASRLMSRIAATERADSERCEAMPRSSPKVLCSASMRARWCARWAGSAAAARRSSSRSISENSYSAERAKLIAISGLS